MADQRSLYAREYESRTRSDRAQRIFRSKDMALQSPELYSLPSNRGKRPYLGLSVEFSFENCVEGGDVDRMVEDADCRACCGGRFEIEIEGEVASSVRQ